MVRRTDTDTHYWLSIISKGRPDRVQPMSAMVGAATWYVPPDDAWQYERQGVAIGAPIWGLSQARNMALEDAFEQGLPCVQLDDDLKTAKFAYRGKGQATDPSLALAVLVERTVESDFMLGGGQPTNNPFFARGGTRLFILGSAICVKPNPLRFDTNLRLKEDYDYTCQHIQRYGGALRIESLIFDFAHYTNKGGAVDDRSEKLEEKMIEYLLEKWPGWIHRHSTRAHEVSLRVPKIERTVLS